MISTLIIDDEHSARTIIRGIVETLPEEFSVVGEANDVKSGLKQIRKHRPDMKTKILTLLFSIVSLSILAQNNVGINTTTDPSAAPQLNAENEQLLEQINEQHEKLEALEKRLEKLEGR